MCFRSASLEVKDMGESHAGRFAPARDPQSLSLQVDAPRVNETATCVLWETCAADLSARLHTTPSHEHHRTNGKDAY